MEQVVITGGLGFIGSNLCDHLLTNTEDSVVIFDNASRKNVLKNKMWLEHKHKKNPRLKIVIADLADVEKLKACIAGSARVYHLAGQVAVTSSVEDPTIDFETNARGSLNVLECARQTNSDPCLILTSTNKVYGELREVDLIEEEKRYNFKNHKQGVDETTIIDPHSPYGCSKFTADSYFKDYYRIYGLKTIIFRMSCIYGYRQFGNEDQGWVAHFIISSLLDRKITIYGDGKQMRDILFIQDLIKAFKSAFENLNKTKGQIYNIGGGPDFTMSLLELIELIEKKINRNVVYEFSHWRPGDQKVYYSNINKAKRDFKWSPKISKEEGVDKLLRWVEKNLKFFIT